MKKYEQKKKATIEKKKLGLGITLFYILCIDCTNFWVLFLFLFRPLDSIFSQNLPFNEKNKNCGLILQLAGIWTCIVSKECDSENMFYVE